MTATSFSKDDPRLTACAFGELDESERAEVEQLLQLSAEARATVNELREFGAQLEKALGAETAAAPALAAEPSALHKRRRGKLLRFPSWPAVLSTLAAVAGMTFVVVWHQHGMNRRLRALHELDATKAPPPAVPIGATPGEGGAGSRNSRAGAADSLFDPLEFNGTLSPEKGTRMSESLKMAKRREWEKVSGQSSRLVAENGRGGGHDASFGSSPEVTLGVRASRASYAEVGGLPSGANPLPSNTEAYAFRQDNVFLGVNENPLSTFSIDVDTASYANVRRFIQTGRRPPADAVRIEELLNYFPYSYPTPTAGDPFGVAMEVASAPWAPTHRLVRIGLKGREIDSAARPRANLVFLIDVSGSMRGVQRLPLVKEAMRLLVNHLRPDDRVAIVTYAGHTGLALPSTPASHARDILDALDDLEAGGGTNGGMGIQLAYDIAKANFVADGVNRVILCTDGDFNVGVTSEGELTRLITEKAKSGVFLTVLGFGMDNLKDATLEKLADVGNGNYGYIDTRKEAEKLLVEQASGTLVTVARDVKLQVEFNSATVASYRLVGYENRLLRKEDFNNDTVDAGEMGAGHTVTALYEIVPVGVTDTVNAGTVDPLKYQPPASSSSKRAATSGAAAELLTLKVRFKTPAGTTSEKREFPLTDSGATFEHATDDFKFAAAVAGFGMVLRDSPFKGTASFDGVLSWAHAGTGQDPAGYRAGFIDLVREAQKLPE